MRLKAQIVNKNFSVINKIPNNVSYDVFIIAVGTPLEKDKKAPNLSSLTDVIEEVGKNLRSGSLVCMRSTVPVGYTRNEVLPRLEKISNLISGEDFHIAFVPERTIEGKALSELKENTQIIGGLTDKCVEKATNLFYRLTSTIVNVSTLEAAELIKFVDNTYRDVTFAYANEVAMISEHMGLDAFEIIKSANIHYPRNNVPIPSPGVGGACLSKDPYILIDTAEKHGYSSSLISEARRVNEIMPKRIVERLKLKSLELGKDLDSSIILICGFAFKGNPETTDLRNSTTLWLLNSLKLETDCEIRGYDPIVNDDEISELGVTPVSLPEGFENVDILIVANNHNSFKYWDINEINTKINHPCIIYDGWRMLNQDIIKNNKNVTYMAPGL